MLEITDDQNLLVSTADNKKSICKMFISIYEKNLSIIIIVQIHQ